MRARILYFGASVEYSRRDEVQLGAIAVAFVQEKNDPMSKRRLVVGISTLALAGSLTGLTVAAFGADGADNAAHVPFLKFGIAPSTRGGSVLARPVTPRPAPLAPAALHAAMADIVKQSGASSMPSSPLSPDMISAPIHVGASAMGTGCAQANRLLKKG